MKTKNSKSKVIIAIICILLIATFAFNNNIFSNKEEGITIGEDYYEAINKDILANKELESDESYWSLISEAQDRVDDKLLKIVQELVNNNENANITKLYNSVINQKDDLSILDSYIEKIDNSDDIDEFLDNIAKINEDLSMRLLINAIIESDYKNNEEAIVNIYPFAYDYGVIYSDYYTNPIYSNYVGMFIKYDREILKLYGYSEEEAKESVRKISKFYMEIANNSKAMDELDEVEEIYNIQNSKTINEIYTNINIDKFLSNYNKKLQVSIVDVNQAKALNAYLVDENLDTLKEYAKLQILQTYAQYGSIEYFNLMSEFEAEQMGTEVEEYTTEEYARDIVTAYFDTEVSKIYLKENVSETYTKYFKNMINEIMSQYKVKIKNNEWLSEQTKQKALVKLENMDINVCYPSQWPTYSEQYVLSENLLENIINMNKIQVEFSIQSTINNEKYWAMSTLTANAFYNLADNSINFPAAILEYELYSENNSYYKNLGSLGMIIAHEITHAFDNNGALFDENGNLNNWWTDEDYKNFEDLKNDVINYYNGYKVNGKSVNGEQTVSENIADLGAVSCIVEIAKQKGATKEEMKQLFEAYANVFASKSTEEYTKLLLIMDTHSPDKIRINAVLQSIEEFYNVYEITEKDEMYKAKEERVKVW